MTQEKDPAAIGHDVFFAFLSGLFLFYVTAKYHVNTQPAAVLDTRDPFEIFPEPVVQAVWWLLLAALVFFAGRALVRAVLRARD